jgi:hypothetical protein
MTSVRRTFSRIVLWTSAALAVWTLPVWTLLAWTSPAFAQDAGVVLVVDHVGQVSLAGPGAPRSIATLAMLPAGARVQLERASTLTLLHVASGDEYTLSGPGNVQVDASGVTASDGATSQRRAASSSKPMKLRGDALAMGGVVMRSGGLRARYPAGVLMAAPTRIAWETLSSNARFKVELRDSAGTVLFTQAAQGSSMAFPAGVPLKSDERYTWTVMLENASMPAAAPASASSANFNLAPQDLRDEAQRLTPDTGAAFSDRLVYGLWLEQAGALGEARQVWQALAEQRPDDDALVARARR